MNRMSNNTKLSSALDLTTSKRYNSNSSSTYRTNSESNASDASSIANTDARVKKKSRRKVRCTQEFSQIDRRSIFPSKTTCTDSVKKVTTKKQKNLDFLPKICLETNGLTEKENFSPNLGTVGCKNDSRRKTSKKKGVVNMFPPKIDLTVSTEKKRDSKGSLTISTESTPEEKRDSEIVFKKRKKKSKKTKVTLRSPLNALGDQKKLNIEEKVSSSMPRTSSFTKRTLSPIKRTSSPTKRTSSITKKTSSLAKRKSSLTKRASSAKTSILKKKKLLKQVPADCEKRSIPSGDVYIEETTNRTFETVQNSSEAKMESNPDHLRKSVRFRSTFEVQNTTTDMSGLKSITFDDSCREEGSFKHYRKSPHVKKLSTKLSNINNATKQLSLDKADRNTRKCAIISPSLRQTVCQEVDSQALLAKTTQNKRSTFEMPSPILALEKKIKVSQHSSRENVNKDISIINLLTPSPKKRESFVFEAVTPSKLLRESTFTMEEGVAQPGNLRNTPKEVESVQPLDISKSNGRRRWNKSLGVSFLDSSGNLHNISPPWEEEPIDLSVSKETSKVNKKMVPKKSGSSRKPPKTPPSTTSTPLPTNKKHSLRFEMLKDNCENKMSESKISTKKRLKMPNFALIHQRAYDKLENLKEMSERKAARAKLLLSGLKPVSEVPVKAKSPAKCKKPLRYSPKPIQPVAKIVESLKVTANIAKNTRLIVPSMSNPKVIPRVLEKKTDGSHIPKLSKNKDLIDKQRLTKLGFKVGANDVKKTTKEEQVKAFVNKSTVQKNTVDTRRNVIQNVRSNRRFELLMKMRNK